MAWAHNLSRLPAPMWDHRSRLTEAECEKRVESSKLSPQDMAKEFLRTLFPKYLCDELCHRKWSRVKELLRTLK